MLSVVELLDVEGVIFEFYDCSFVVVDITVVRCTEDGDHHGEVLSPIPPMHFVPVHLSLMGSYH